MHILEKFEDHYVYGPLTEEEIQSVKIAKRLTWGDNGGMYVGVNQPQDQLSNKLVPRPVVVPSVDIPQDNLIESVDTN